MAPRHLTAWSRGQEETRRGALSVKQASETEGIEGDVDQLYRSVASPRKLHCLTQGTGRVRILSNIGGVRILQNTGDVRILEIQGAVPAVRAQGGPDTGEYGGGGCVLTLENTGWGVWTPQNAGGGTKVSVKSAEHWL